MEKKERVKVWLEISIDGKKTGVLEYVLFNDIVPKTSENFRALCTGELGEGQSGKKLHYKNSVIHRIVGELMFQGGDITRHNGTGGESIYNGKFEDENFAITHTKRGLLSMANGGPDTNGSQFFCIFNEAPWLDGHHVAFGELVDGFEVLEKIENSGSRHGIPNCKLEITDCGERGLG